MRFTNLAEHQQLHVRYNGITGYFDSSPKYTRRTGNTGYSTDKSHEFSWKTGTGICSSFERLSFGAVSRRRPPIRVGIHSFFGVPVILVSALLSCVVLFRTCMGFLGMDCNVFGTSKVLSGNILVSKSYNFFNAIGFCRFLNLKNLSSPNLPCFQGFFIFQVV